MTEFARTDLDTLQMLDTGLAQQADGAADAAAGAARGAQNVAVQVAAAIARRRQELVQAEAALQACRQSKAPDCSGPARQVSRATERLATAHAAQRLVESAVGAFEPARTRFVRETGLIASEGRAELSRHTSRLTAYLAGSGGGSTGFVGGSGSSGGAGPAGGAGGGATGGTPIAGAPAGFAMVAVSAIDRSDSGVTGPESFGKGYSPDDLGWAFDALHEVVLPAMAQGKDASFFHDLDQRMDLSGSRSYSDTYSGFFGDSAIRLDPGSGAWTVTNGYHRIWVASSMGVSEVPARIT